MERSLPIGFNRSLALGLLLIVVALVASTCIMTMPSLDLELDFEEVRRVADGYRVDLELWDWSSQPVMNIFRPDVFGQMQCHVVRDDSAAGCYWLLAYSSSAAVFVAIGECSYRPAGREVVEGVYWNDRRPWGR